MYTVVSTSLVQTQVIYFLSMGKATTWCAVDSFPAFSLQGCTKSAIDVSAMHGHLAVVQWLSENRPEGCSTNAMDWAAKEGKLVRESVCTRMSSRKYDYVLHHSLQQARRSNVDTVTRTPARMTRGSLD